MSVRNASGNVFSGAVRRPSMLIAVAAIALAAGGIVVISQLDTSSTTSPARVVSNPAPLPVVPAPAAQAAEQSTVFIVTSEAEAAALRLSIEEGDRVRHSQGLSPMGDRVVVAFDQAEAARLEAALNETNQMLVSLGQPPMTIVRHLAPSAGSPGAGEVTAESVAREHEQYLDPYLNAR